MSRDSWLSVYLLMVLASAFGALTVAAGKQPPTPTTGQYKFLNETCAWSTDADGSYPVSMTYGDLTGRIAVRSTLAGSGDNPFVLTVLDGTETISELEAVTPTAALEGLCLELIRNHAKAQVKTDYDAAAARRELLAELAK